MKRRTGRVAVSGVLCAMIINTAVPLSAAEYFGGVESTAAESASVIITEVQTGAAVESDEFIELYNTSSEPVDITGWQLRYANAGAEPDATELLATVIPGSNDEDERVMLPGYAYFVLHDPGITLPPNVKGQAYTASLSGNDKTVALFARDETICEMLVQDAVAWEASLGTTHGEGTAVPVTSSSVHIVLQRYIDAGVYVDTDNNAHDFLLAAGTPGRDNPHLVPPGGGTPGSPSPLLPFAANACTPHPGDPPVEDPSAGLDPLLITEVLPNPGPGQQEPADEFIELYNPNDEPFQLAGYTLEVGITAKARYTFETGLIEPGAYRAFYYDDTKLRLVNTNGQVRLLDPENALLAETEAYANAGDDKAWALIGDTWQWAPIATPNAANPEPDPIAQPPDPLPVIPPNNGLLLPQITELLPAPGNNQLEFIELYNPNDTPFDLGGYVLEVGTTTKYHHTFAPNTMLPPKAYVAFFSDQTRLTLANKAGQVRLFDPSGTVLAEGGVYANAKENQAWAFMDGAWHWTTSPTPNALNILTAPAPQAKAKKTASATTKKPAAKKSQSKTKKGSNTKENQAALLATTKPDDPLHPGALAAVAGFALLYGAYEYRRDLANKFHQFRSYRAARQALRQGAKGG